MAALLEQLEPVGQRLLREVGARARDLHERELERKARVAALAHVVDCQGQEVAEPQHARLGELVRLREELLARLLGDRDRLRHRAQVLDDEEVPKMLEEVVDEPADVLALLGELFDERERAGRVVVDDEVAELEERLLVDRAEQLQHRLHRQLAAGRGRELVEERHGVAEAPLRRARDLRQRRLRRLEAFARPRPGRAP